MPLLSEQPLKQLCAALFEAAGASASEAEIVSDSLVTSNLLGHDSHGVIRVMQYLRSIRQGDIVPGSPLEVVRETDTLLLVDGHWNFGQMTARSAMQKAIEKARRSGVVELAVRRCNHAGRMGEYAQQAAEAGLACWLVANAGRARGNVAPFGGAAARLATNPICFAAPWKEDGVFLLDLTTSIAPEGKVRVKLNRGERLPEGWILDAAGQPSTDPRDLYGPPPGALLPLGGSMGHKGFALSLMVEILGGILTGTGTVGPEKPQVGNGIFALVLDIETFLPRSEFQPQLQALIDYMKSCPTRPGFQEVLVPGEPEFRTLRHRRAHGIPVEEETWRQICTLAAELGVTPPIPLHARAG
ncbi:MAG: Ldh family oxidoreductase [Planctomycetes bacterium]|nr:Ldh family oxidoreductase [Planctomycetota bacterium]